MSIVCIIRQKIILKKRLEEFERRQNACKGTYTGTIINLRRRIEEIDENQNPTDVYHAFAVGGVYALNACKGFVELPLGKGDVDWKNYLLALKKIGYDGFLTIERECGDNPADDIQKAVSFLQEELEKL